MKKIFFLLCILVLLMYTFIQYFTIEGFSENSSFGQWELVLRQSYNDQYNKSPFNGNTSVNLNALYDSYGNITEPNYYNSKLYSEYDFSDNRLLKLIFYSKMPPPSRLPPIITHVWSQNNNTGEVRNITKRMVPLDFIGLNQTTDSSYAFVDSSNNYILGLSQRYLDSRTDISYIPFNSVPDSYSFQFEKIELFLWNPRPNDKNTFNGNYENITISKVDMNDTNHKNFWNKSKNSIGASNDADNRYSYCFGKLKCNNNDYSPIKNSDDTYKPYCDSDSSMNPVYCEGSALYNTNSASSNPVTIGTLSYDMMGKYASGTSNEEYFNLFRGLTTPYSSDYIDPKISGNDIVVYDSNNSKYVKNNICNYLNNSNLINGTNIQKECEEKRYTGNNTGNDNDLSKCIANYGDTIDSRYKNYVCNQNESCIGYKCGTEFGKCIPKNDLIGNKCIANYGDKIDSRYKNYVCNKNELCIGYECGVKFGNCSPSLL